MHLTVKGTLFSAIFGLLLSGTASANVPKVVTDIPITHSLVTRVMAGIGMPDLIVDRGASPHEYSLRPSNAASLEVADLVFWISNGLTPWLDDALNTLARNAKVIELMDAKGATVLSFREGATFETHSHQHKQDEDGHDEHKHDEDEHATGNVDPHGWLDPYNGRIWLDVIATALSKIDPTNSDIYFANATQAKADIDTVISELEATLAEFRGTNFIVYHDAYQYFEKRFDVLAAGSISLGDVSDPSPARIAEVRKKVEELGIICVFSEPQFNSELVRTVTDGVSVKTRVIDSLGTQFTLGPDFYLNVLRGIAQSMASCL
ncbi:Zinc ABC transporter, periplasmic-binding protein ZnuA [hydrothermal vent metagenome]|jgi:zinc transport system substrate-binding protein|uniref:Zinc ABC transporter, periplasmic-binding protein ZnuA n=1 Tax=hydrothermal vent metagenome TaxID=652676 RepID=A0A170PS99_9ZZZZ|nr:zinc transporter [Gammaproteobacteria bacterium]|tara:strand:+ start:2381 stop:3340 length:960 start_codon:yes stop_codon:yes gene_type:complete